MFISSRGALVRNGVLAVINGGITLVILLIAPLGLAAVIVNTVLVSAATLMAGFLVDRVVVYLYPVPQGDVRIHEGSRPARVTRQFEAQDLDQLP